MPAEPWIYNADEWNRTRVVEVSQGDDGLWYWRRSRIKGGILGKVVATSGGWDDEHWCRVSAVKENYPLPVPDMTIDVPPGDDDPGPDMELDLGVLAAEEEDTTKSKKK